METRITKTRQECIAIWQDNHLYAVMLKNGENQYYRTKKFGFEDHVGLLPDKPEPELPKDAKRIE